MSEETSETKVSFKVKTSTGGNHSIDMSETASVLDLKNLLAASEYENVPAERQRLIYSGRVMKNEEALSTYKIKNGNTIHMVKSAQSNTSQNPANSGAVSSGSGGAAAGVPTNMAAGTANNPLAGLTGARYAGHVQLPGMEMFGPDGGMGPPPSEDDMADMLSNPAMAQMMNEALQNPQMIDLMIQSNPQLRAMGPQARQMLQSPMFRQMMTNPDMLRQAAQMRRMMGGGGGGGGGAASFPAPGVTDTTPAGAAGSESVSGQANAQNPFGNLFGAPGASGAVNPFASMFGGGGGFPFQAPTASTPAGSPPPPASAGQGTPFSAPGTGTSAAAGAGTPSTDGASNPFAALFPGMGATTGAATGPSAGAGGPPLNPFNMTPEQMQQMQQMAQQMGWGDMMGGGLGSGFGGISGGAGSSPAPADTRPPEEMYADQLRQLNDMGFFDFDANVQALRRSGGSVTGAVNSLLGG